MDMKRLARWILPLASVSVLFALACHKKVQPVLGPVGPPVPENLIQEYVAQGDEFYKAMHLYAWRRAETAYSVAYSLAARQEIRNKLALVRLLRMAREIDEDIPCPTMREDVRFICENPSDARAQALCELAGAYIAGPVAAAESMKRVDPSVLQIENSPLDAYFFGLYSRTIGSDAKDDALRKQLNEKYKDSPLFMYLSLNLGSPRLTQQFPDFAEAWEFSAEASFQKNLIRSARNGFANALELIPDYTRAQNGLANIYFFTLEDYPNALKAYQNTLKWDRQNTGALFGKGAALHHLSQYEESNATLDLMLSSDLSRNGRVTQNSVQYYRGEAYYYKSYNSYLTKDPARSREFIDLGKKELPQAEEINYLSGLLYYNAGQLDAAKEDFEKAIRSGKNCYAYHYLGMIELRSGGPTAAAQFLTSSACMERGLQVLQQNIKVMAGLDVDPGEKAALQSRMEMKLREYRDSSADMIQRMIALIRDALIDPTWKQTYMGTMNDLLVKVQSIFVK
jgi:tetratricopeptide (TPR) repeat protein